MANRKSVANRSELAAGPRLLPPETARAGRVVTVLPAVAAEIVVAAPDDHVALAAMAIPGMAAAQHAQSQTANDVGSTLDKALNFGAETSAAATLAMAAKAKLSSLGGGIRRPSQPQTSD